MQIQFYRAVIQCESVRPPYINFSLPARHNAVSEPISIFRWLHPGMAQVCHPQYQSQLLQSQPMYTYRFWLQYQLNQCNTSWFFEAEFQIENSFSHQGIITTLYTFKIRKIKTEGKKTLACYCMWIVPMNYNKLPRLAYLLKGFSAVTFIPHI